MSRFVSGGTVDEPVQRDDAWIKAQQAIEAKHREKEEQKQQNGGKSLFETLEANKAAKQEAFEEATRLRNQFRALHDDEIEFLDSVLESTRAKEAAVKKETIDQLNDFRQRQELKEKSERGQETEEQAQETESWTVGAKKRKRTKNGPAIAGVKLRKTSSVAETSAKIDGTEEKGDNRKGGKTAAESAESKTLLAIDEQSGTKTAPAVKQPTVETPATTAGSTLGLGRYSSDDD
ncbi:hypothetical protein MBLNU457_5752t1 [Dothideomycetes sp. NU457]